MPWKPSTRSPTALKRDLCLWSFGRGVRTGPLDFRKHQPSTEEPGAVLTFMASQNTNPICVTLDLAPHLQNSLILRTLRDAIDRLSINNGTLVMYRQSRNPARSDSIVQRRL